MSIDRSASARIADRLLAGRIAHFEVGSDLDQAVETLREWVAAV